MRRKSAIAASWRPPAKVSGCWMPEGADHLCQQPDGCLCSAIPSRRCWGAHLSRSPFPRIPRHRIAGTASTGVRSPRARLRRKDGSVSCGCMPLPAPSWRPDGQVSGIVALVTDITARKQAEEALHASERLVHTVIDHAPLALFALDREGRFTLSEGQALRRLGISPQSGQVEFDPYRDVPEITAAARRALGRRILDRHLYRAGSDLRGPLRSRCRTRGCPRSMLGMALDDHRVPEPWKRALRQRNCIPPRSRYRTLIEHLPTRSPTWPCTEIV